MGRGRKTGQRGWGRGGSRTDASTRMGERPEKSREANEPQEAEVSGEIVVPWDSFRSPPGQAWPSCRWLKRESNPGRPGFRPQGSFQCVLLPKAQIIKTIFANLSPGIRSSLFPFRKSLLI